MGETEEFEHGGTETRRFLAAFFDKVMPSSVLSWKCFYCEKTLLQKCPFFFELEKTSKKRGICKRNTRN